jgi:type IV secretory pathway VirB10-like protein
MIAAKNPGLASRRVMIGIALSILAHVAIVFSSRPTPQPYIAPPPVPAPIVLHLQPPPAPAVEAAPPPPVPTTRQQAAAPPRPARRVIAVAPKPSTAAAPEVVVEAQPVETPPPPPPKKFDLDAARSTARIVGVTDAPNADDAPLARLKKQEDQNHIRSESKAAQAISAAKRGDCKDGLPGGLLAPLIMLTQKAGTGCKW